MTGGLERAVSLETIRGPETLVAVMTGRNIDLSTFAALTSDVETLT